MVDSKYFGIPFATAGDKATIPEATQPSGAISFTQGYGPDYERDPATDPTAKRVPRDETNELYFQITNALKFLQLYGTPEWYATDDASNQVSYPLSARVRYDAGSGMQVWRSLVASNTATPGSDATKWGLDNPFDIATLEATLAEALAGSSALKIITPRRLASATQRGVWNFGAASGTANALTVTLSPAPAALSEGMRVTVKIASSNTSASPTLSVNSLGNFPIVTQRGSPAQAGDLPAGAIVTFAYSSSTWVIQGISYSEVPQVPTADVVLYVRTDGNDNNDGGANTAARAFATIQKAIDVVTTRYSASASFGVRIVLGMPGTYAPAINNRYPGAILIEGSGGSYIITGGDVGIGGPCSFASRVGRITLKNINLRNTATTGFAVSAACLGGSLFLDTIAITSLLNNPNYVPIYIVENGVLSMSTSFVLNGGDNTQRQMRSLIQVSTGGVFGGTPTTMTMSLATSSWVAGMVEAQMTGVAIFGGITVNASGAFSGPRYTANSNGVINTYGGGANFFPGSTAGAVSTGGQYL